MSKFSLRGSTGTLATAVVFGALLFTCSGLASAQSKLGVIDVEAILTNSERGKAVLASIREFSKTRSEALKVLEKELVELSTTYERGRLSLAEGVLADMQKELEDKSIAARRAQDDAERELKEMQQKEFVQVEKDILPIINAVGKEQGYTMIFNKYEGGLVYADASVDITQLVIERFDSASEKDGN